MLHEIARAFDVSWWWFLHVTGADAPGSVEYNFWSGAGSDFGELTLVAGLLAIYKSHLNCHEPRCPWPSRHVYDLDGQQVKLCVKHHPDFSKLKAGQVQAHHDSMTP